MVVPRYLLAAGVLLLLAEPSIARMELPRAVQTELRVVARELAVSRRARLVASRAAAVAQQELRDAVASGVEPEASAARERAEQAGEVYYFWQARCVALEQQRSDLRARRRSWRSADGTISPRQMPASGAIEVPFGGDGSRSGWEDGIGIRVKAGDWVRAAAPGTVAFAGRLPVYGGVVVLDHGLRVFTVYGGLDTPDVAVDAPVSVGSRLGQAATGAGGLVYFSVRRGRQAVNPQDWHREAESDELAGE